MCAFAWFTSQFTKSELIGFYSIIIFLYFDTSIDSCSVNVCVMLHTDIIYVFFVYRIMISTTIYDGGILQ
jgi:hypothetical protein